MRRSMRVESFMTKNPVAVDISTPLVDAAAQMRDKGVGCVVVLRDRKVVGLVTDRMITVQGLAEGLGPDTPVEEVMLADPARLGPDDNIFHAIDAMRGANVARRILVVDAYDELLGVVSISDIAVIAKDLIDAIMLEETHHALAEARVLTGGKRLVKVIRRPTREPTFEQETAPVTEPTAEGLPTKGGNVPAGPRRSRGKSSAGVRI
jgi:CBS domain-containing protein